MKMQRHQTRQSEAAHIMYVEISDLPVIGRGFAHRSHDMALDIGPTCQSMRQSERDRLYAALLYRVFADRIFTDEGYAEPTGGPRGIRCQ